MVEAHPFGNAAAEFTATKESISETSAAKFRDVKLLEQTIFGPALKTNDLSGGTKEGMKNSDVNLLVGQKRKREDDGDDGPDLGNQETQAAFLNQGKAVAYMGIMF